MEIVLDPPLDAVIVRPRSLRERQAATLVALDSFMEQDEAEHRETLRVLRQGLGEDRAGQRPVFSQESGAG